MAGKLASALEEMPEGEMGDAGGEESGSDADELAADFEAATGIKVKDPTLLVDVIARCCAMGEDLDEPEEYASPKPGKGKGKMAVILG